MLSVSMARPGKMPQLKDHLGIGGSQERDHRKLGRDWKSSSLTMNRTWPAIMLPNGGILIEELEKLAKEMEEKAGYCESARQKLAKEDLLCMLFICRIRGEHVSADGTRGVTYYSSR